MPDRRPGRVRPAARWIAAAAVIALLVILAPVTPLTRYGGDILIRAAFYSALAFVAYYSLLARWWGNPMGRMIVALDLGVALALLPDIVRMDFGVVLSAVVLLRVTAAALTLIPVTILSRMWLLGRLNGWWPRLPWRHRQRDGGDGEDAG